MSSPNAAPGTAREWIERARAKLALAKVPLPGGGVWEDLCYMAQQSSELAIKAVFIQNGWRFPFIHDLDQLLTGLQSHGLAISPSVQAADQLTEYAVATRYPGIAPPVTKGEYDDAILIADTVLAWAKSLVP